MRPVKSAEEGSCGLGVGVGLGVVSGHWVLLKKSRHPETKPSRIDQKLATDALAVQLFGVILVLSDFFSRIDIGHF
jgi:hypothetical protein